LRDSLQSFIDANRPQIEALLKDYGFPTLPIPDSLRGSGTKPSGF
jgi:hypothetical protein